MNMISPLGLRAVGMALLVAGLLSHSPSHAQTVIKLGTIAPEGSVWHDALLEVRQHWREHSDGDVELRIYAGGVLGGEEEMVRKMQRSGLDALAISGSGLPLIARSVSCLNLPMLFSTYEEIERVRASLSQDLESSFEERGFKVLSWAEAGWAHFFTKSPVRTPRDLQALRLWTSVGSPESERVLKQLGFRVVPLPATDMRTALQTGLIEAIDVPPLFALLDRSYEEATFMTDLKFAPVIVGTVITSSAWERISSEYRPALMATIQDVSSSLRVEVRRAEEEAIAEMVGRGLSVVSLDASNVAEWRDAAEDVYRELGCAREYPELFEKVMSMQQPVATSP